MKLYGHEIVRTEIVKEWDGTFAQAFKYTDNGRCYRVTTTLNVLGKKVTSTVKVDPITHVFIG